MAEQSGDRARLIDSALPVLRAVAALLALTVAWVHLLHPRLGLGRLLLYLQVGTLYDPRPPLFVLASVVIFVGLGLGVLGTRRRPLYLGGIVLMATFLGGYLSWHTVLEHGAFWPYIEELGHRDLGVLTSIRLHLQDDAIALVSKTAELLLLMVLVVLLRADR